MTSHAGLIASECLKSWTTGDFVTTRSLLADDVAFIGPMGATEGIDDYVSGVQGMAKMVKGAEQKKVIVDGDDVCIIYDLVTTVAGALPTAGWYHVRDGKIDWVRAFFDARPLMADGD
jgi:hypothetical protein